MNKKCDVERAAFDILVVLCTGSARGRKAVAIAPTFSDALARALEIVNPLNIEAEDRVTTIDESLVESAYSFVAAVALVKSAQESLAQNVSFLQACFLAATSGSSAKIRNAATDVVSILCRSHLLVEQNEFTLEKASELFQQILTDQSNSSDNDYSGSNIQIIAAEGVFHVLDRLHGEKEQLAIENVAKAYSTVIRQRSLSKSSGVPCGDKKSGELAFSLIRILLLGMSKPNAESYFGSCAVGALVGTIQWRFDVKTTLEDDEVVYWDAVSSHAMEILAIWFEQGKSYISAGGIDGESMTRKLKDSVWMVARPGKAPRKALDFGSALIAASKEGESSTRLAASRLLAWMHENC